MGDVVTALGRAVQDEDHDVTVLLPKYDILRYGDITELKQTREFWHDGVQVRVWRGVVEGAATGEMLESIKKLFQMCARSNEALSPSLPLRLLGWLRKQTVRSILTLPPTTSPAVKPQLRGARQQLEQWPAQSRTCRAGHDLKPHTASLGLQQCLCLYPCSCTCRGARHNRSASEGAWSAVSPVSNLAIDCELKSTI